MYGRACHEIRNVKREVIFAPSSAKSLRDAVEQAVASSTDLSDAVLSSEYRRVEGGIQVQRRSDLAGGNLRDARFQRARLDAVDFREASLKRADMTDAQLSYENFSGANLKDSTLKGVNGWGAKFVGADLRRADLTGAHFGWADFTGADLRGADLRGADLKAANLSMANLDGTRTEGAKFGALTKSKGVSLQGSDLTHQRRAWTTVLGWTGTALLFVVLLWVLSRF
jgi:uncharacterized protein YjbI with pentapeptide repeats